MAHANRAALRLEHNAILPEHILLGLIQDSAGVAAKALVMLDVNLAQLQESVEAQVALALNQREHPHADSRQVLVGAQEQADLLKHNAIGTGHMLLALLQAQAQLASQNGIDPPILRDKLLELLPSDESAL